MVKLVSKLIIPLAVVGGILFLAGSGRLDGLAEFIKNLIPSGGGGSTGGGGGFIGTGQTIGGISGGSLEADAVNISGGVLQVDPSGALIVDNSNIDPRSISAKTQDSLFRFKSKNPDIVSDIELFRNLQAQQLSNVSTGRSVILTREQIASIASQPFSKQELADAKALEERRVSAKDKALKLSGVDTVILKRLEAERARIGVFDSASVQNPNFNIGAPSDATPEQIKIAIQNINFSQQKALNQQRAEISREANTNVGARINQDLAQAGVSQADFLKLKGINLQGSNLNARALGRLQELGLI